MNVCGGPSTNLYRSEYSGACYGYADFAQIANFFKLSGLKINVDKSKLLLKGDLRPANYRDIQLFIVSKLKYLGVWIGHIKTEQAFAECLAIAPKRPQFLRKLPLGLNERVLSLKIWFLPLLTFTAGAYQRNDLVISQLCKIYLVGLKFSSWSVALPILSQPPEKGYNLLQPEAYLHWRFAHMFVGFTRQPHKLSADIVQPMTNSSKPVGLVPHPAF